MDDFPSRLGKLAALWNRVEKRAKAAEQFRHETIIAAINELRYAGRRIVDALALMHGSDASKNHEEIREHLIVAENYLRNADHDITDSVCFIVLTRVDETIVQHGFLKIQTECPQFQTLYPIVRLAVDIVQGAREDRAKRVAEYEKLANEYQPKLEELYRHLVANRALALGDPLTNQFQELWRKLDLLNAIVVVGAIAGVLGLVFELYDLFFLRGGHGL